MTHVQTAVAAYLQAETGVPAVRDRTRAAHVYPLLAVSVREEGTVLLDGGRQAEHTYRVSVTAVSDRDRDGSAALLSSLTPILLRGVPMESPAGTRVLHPLDIRAEGQTLTFSVVLCVPVPPAEETGAAGTEAMERLTIGI